LAPGCHVYAEAPKPPQPQNQPAREFDVAQASTSYRAQGTKHASNTSEPLAVPFQWVRRHNLPARTIFRRLLTAIVDGSDHPCWQTNDASTQLALLRPREQNRLLDSGRVTRKR
jgi:hypothetical protein